ncbi:MAG: site-2 protease family protein [Clostridiales bacterium]|nr:site-2 protease family protein [Candidatus Cacconaster stercorequi]
MYHSKPTKINISPAAVVLLAAFIWLTSAALLASLLLAALCHELGHYAALRRLGVRVSEVRISVMGAEMKMAGRGLSYGGEMLAVAAGPAVNLILAPILAAVGRYCPVLYLFAGAQLVLGVFNLLPVRPLDGGTLLWLITARFTDPFLADRISRIVNKGVGAALLGAAVYLWRVGGSPFLLMSAAGLLFYSAAEKGLVKRARKG